MQTWVVGLHVCEQGEQGPQSVLAELRKLLYKLKHHIHDDFQIKIRAQINYKLKKNSEYCKNK